MSGHLVRIIQTQKKRTSVVLPIGSSVAMSHTLNTEQNITEYLFCLSIIYSLSQLQSYKNARIITNTYTV